MTAVELGTPRGPSPSSPLRRPRHPPAPELVADSVRAIAGHPLMLAVLEAAEVLLMVVTRDRRVVAVNHELRQLTGGRLDELLGLRPGELLRCCEAEAAPEGCGSGPRCAACGCLAALLESIETSAAASADYNVSFERPGERPFERPGGVDTREFRVRASPIELDGQPLTVLSLRDVSAEKRRETLEHVFLHDLMNTLGGLSGWSSLLRETLVGEDREIAGRIAVIGERLRVEIEEHRALLFAEEGTLVARLADTTPDEVLSDVERVYGAHRAAEGRVLELVRGAAGTLCTDRALLVRVVGNMVKNAFEAVPVGGRVVVRSAGDAERVAFHVWNPGAIPDAVQLRIFTRSFSTKAARGRGLGTFAMKLFGERYLGGRVGFRSTGAEGTTFSIVLPRGQVRG
jgi:hypothetical protein